ncbi:MAG: diguanylate cyclase [Pseudomonadota bacterium]|nr:diguanylate cyclase [Pseudomonadota bacterium]
MKVLLAEDDRLTRRVLQAHLQRWNFEVVAVADGDAAWDCLSQPDAPLMALLDWEMPGADGPEVCRRVRALKSDRYTYLLMLTGREANADLVVGLESGADDYVKKPFQEAELHARLRAGQRIVGLHQELVEMREVMRHQATHDGLTGLLNRTAMLEGLRIEASALARRGGSLAVAMLDLDHFKQINDTLGHGAGDLVLQETARRLTWSLRPYDRIGRMGGEEFLVIMPDCDAAGAAAVAERVRALIAESPVMVGQKAVPVSTSIGVATITCADDVGGLVDRADVAMYRAKHAGRNRVMVAPDLPVVANVSPLSLVLASA